MRATRDGKGPPSTDLLVCFPSRAHLSLMPKPICSPAHHRRPSHRASSPLAWSSRSKHNADVSEPTSPKVTCAGQIKVRAKPSSCRNWQSVMEEIERMHKKNRRKIGWMEALGLKKDVMQFLTCLRNIRFDFRCFGAPPGAEVTSDEDEEEDEHVEIVSKDGEDDDSRAVFSKWFMILQEENAGVKTKVVGDEEEAAPPPANALLLMRCRSAPAKSWLEEREEEEEEEEEEERRKGEIEEEERGKRRDLSEFAGEIGEIDRVMEEIKEKISRCRSWK